MEQPRLFDWPVVAGEAGPVTEDDLVALRDRVLDATARVPFQPAAPATTLYVFTADEIMDLRKLLLPNRMKHHDNSGEQRLRSHVASVQRSRGKKPPHD